MEFGNREGPSKMPCRSRGLSAARGQSQAEVYRKSVPVGEATRVAVLRPDRRRPAGSEESRVRPVPVLWSPDAGKKIGFHRKCSRKPPTHGCWVRNAGRPVKLELRINLG